ncbi:MAG: hypothetical protein ABS45_12040 [Comamonas sp. SCN 65-56]|uniref:hypothetical protein n=1 Tax=Comamonas sp. SCN 65-56 TaxID=1660095 RepID=UPI00086EF936|nr:hypothetical protein [Comamonas sp. SCN 65-56]ODS91171.1 MAG: hypothetical protein ABS45_12040 [Comamonas sp. SCN 65-56]
MQDEDIDDHRTTRELLETLDADYRKCYQHVIRQLNVADRTEDGLISADTEFEARQLIRAAFAYIEGATYILKVEASFNSEERGVELTPQQQHFIFEADFEINDKGEVTQKPAKIPLVKNIRFAFSIFAEANGIPHKLDTKAEWWQLLLDSIRVRDRLMHPREPSDLDVAPSETIAMIKAKGGFDAELQGLLSARAA